MVRYLAWIERTAEQPMDRIDAEVRAMADESGQQLNPASLIKAWRKEEKRGVQIGTEQFPGSSPIWLWEA